MAIARHSRLPAYGVEIDRFRPEPISFEITACTQPVPVMLRKWAELAESPDPSRCLASLCLARGLHLTCGQGRTGIPVRHDRGRNVGRVRRDERYGRAHPSRVPGAGR